MPRKKRPELKNQELEIWNYLVDYIDQQGFAPTVQQIAEGALDSRWPNAAFYHMKNMIQNGYLQKTQRGYYPIP